MARKVASKILEDLIKTAGLDDKEAEKLRVANEANEDRPRGHGASADDIRRVSKDL